MANKKHRRKHQTAIDPESTTDKTGNVSSHIGEDTASNSNSVLIKVEKEAPETVPPLDSLALDEETHKVEHVEVQYTESKGYCLFSKHKIKPGTLILSEPPLIRLTQAEEDADKASSTSSGDEESILNKSFSSLARSTQKAYLKLYDSKKSDFSHIRSIYYSNCYNLSGPNKSSKTSLGGSAIGMLASRINHSCLPNVQFSFDEERGMMTFRAIKPIPKGREIFSNYDNVYELRAGRQRRQMLYYGFKCDCEACEPKTEFWTKSDERRRAMIEARRDLKRCEKEFEQNGSVGVQSDPVYALERLASLLVKEGLVGLPLADTYRSLSKWAERKGDKKEAKKWKGKELEVCVVCFGEGSLRCQLARSKLEALE